MHVTSTKAANTHIPALDMLRYVPFTLAARVPRLA